MRRTMKAAAVGVAVIALIVGVGIAYGAMFETIHQGEPSWPLQTTTATTVCSISGQPGNLLLRILSDSTQTPVAGAQVSATNKPAYCGSSPATSQTTRAFTTNSTEWYSLDTTNNAGYSVTVRYSGQSYTLTADLRPVSTTCATLFVPSGRTNATITGFQTSC